MYQNWRNLLFLHWEYDVEAIQSTLPEGLRVDTFAGKAYLGIVPFFMEDVHPRFFPTIPGLSDFQEVNVRTYVSDHRGIPGVWFYSLDANQWLANWSKRLFRARVHHDPYPLVNVEAHHSDKNLFNLDGLAKPTGTYDHAIMSPGVDVEVFGLEPVT